MRQELLEKIEEATSILKNNICNKGYTVYFSGGKDSCALKHLVQQTGVQARYVYIETTAEGYMIKEFLKEYHPDVKLITPEKSVFDLIKKYGHLPTLRNKFCCRDIFLAADRKLFEESKCIVLGNRSDEPCNDWTAQAVLERTNGHKIINPLYNFSTEEIWEYIKEYSIPVSKEYSYGSKRSYSCPLCIMLNVFTKKLNAELYPELVAKYKEAINYVYSNNPTIRSQYDSADAYWEYYLNVTRAESQKSWLNHEKTLLEADLQESPETGSVIL